MCFRQQKKRLSPLFLIADSDALADLGLLTHSVAQVIQLGAADFTAADGLDGDDRGGVDGEDLLAADSVEDAADGDGLVDTAVFLGDNGAVKSLVPLAVALLDTDGDADVVSHVHFGELRLHGAAGESLDEIHDVFPPFGTDVRAR